MCVCLHYIILYTAQESKTKQLRADKRRCNNNGYSSDSNNYYSITNNRSDSSGSNYSNNSDSNTGYSS